MTHAAKAQEPSMEEILASIRRIIADDDAAKTPAKLAEPVQPAAPPGTDIPQPAARSAAAPPAAAAASSMANGQYGVSAMLGSFDAPDTAPTEPAQPDFVDLTDRKQAKAADTPGSRTGDGKADVFNPAQPPPVANTLAEARRQFQRSMPERPLLAPSTTAAVDSAFNALAQTVLVKNARTLDEMVTEMIRPMLKAWLDENLPEMVERIVRDEIERVSRGRSGTK
jgi:uncharacterized protein